MILVTGHAGLVGSALVPALRSSGRAVRGLDLRAEGAELGDVRDFGAVCRAMDGVSGVVCLAAVSRVMWAERDPGLCQAVNVDGLANVLRVALGQPRPPWVLFASSREVYGHTTGRVTEDQPLAPVNAYGRSKATGERMVQAARSAGLRTAIVRLSNVFGSVDDHHDRVVPAFCRAATERRGLLVEGTSSVFDFVHVSDAVRGLVALTGRLETGESPRTVHLVTGVSTSLLELAELCCGVAGGGVPVPSAERTCDVSRFEGDPWQAYDDLGWRARVPLAVGVAQLVRDFQACAKRHLAALPSG